MSVILKKPAYELFLGAIKRESTRECYTRTLRAFMRFANLESYEVLAKEDPDTVTDQLESWVISLKEKNLKRGSISNKLNSVELFLAVNRMIWHKKVVRMQLPSDNEIPGGEKPFTEEEVFKLLSACANPREKCLVHYFSSTGARPASIIDPDPLRVGDLYDIEDCYGIQIYDDSKERYWAFLTPEARKAFDSYIAARKRNGEQITSNSPLFHNIGDNAKTESLNLSNLYRIFRKLIRKAEIERKKATDKRFDIAIIYGLRKYYNGILKLNNEVNSNIAEKLMAHKNGLDGHYLKPTMEQCFNEFKKAIPQLTIDPNRRNELLVKTGEVKTMKKSKLEELIKLETLKTICSLSTEEFLAIQKKLGTKD